MPPENDPAAMSDRELDVLVAEAIFGYQWYGLVGWPPILCLPEHKMPDRVPCERPAVLNHHIGTHKVPRFSTDIAAAWLVVEKLRNHWGNFDLKAGLSWHCRPANALAGDAWGTADTAAQAICLAALQTFTKGPHAPRE